MLSAFPSTSGTAPQWTPRWHRPSSELGPVTILVNNAGGVFWSGILDTTENGWDALYKSNLRHVYLCTQRVARNLVEQKLPGSIISVTSIEGVRAAPGYATYAAAKAGVINYTKTAALELAPHGIRVNALAPDITMTEGIKRSRRRAPSSGSGSRSRWDVRVMSTKWQERQCFSRPTCPATSPVKQSTSTAAPMPPAAGTTTPRPAHTRSDQQLNKARKKFVNSHPLIAIALVPIMAAII